MKEQKEQKIIETPKKMNDNLLIFVCNDCNYNCVNANDLEYHKTSYHNLHICHTCGRKCSGFFDLDEHIREVHFRILHCGECNFWCNDIGILSDHICDFKCTKCDFNCQKKEDLEVHFKSSHSQISSICDKKNETQDVILKMLSYLTSTVDILKTDLLDIKTRSVIVHSVVLDTFKQDVIEEIEKKINEKVLSRSESRSAMKQPETVVLDGVENSPDFPSLPLQNPFLVEEKSSSQQGKKIKSYAEVTKTKSTALEFEKEKTKSSIPPKPHVLFVGDSILHQTDFRRLSITTNTAIKTQKAYSSVKDMNSWFPQSKH